MRNQNFKTLSFLFVAAASSSALAITEDAKSALDFLNQYQTSLDQYKDEAGKSLVPIHSIQTLRNIFVERKGVAGKTVRDLNMNRSPYAITTVEIALRAPDDILDYNQKTFDAIPPGTIPDTEVLSIWVIGNRIRRRADNKVAPLQVRPGEMKMVVEDLKWLVKNTPDEGTWTQQVQGLSASIDSRNESLERLERSGGLDEQRVELSHAYQSALDSYFLYAGARYGASWKPANFAMLTIRPEN